MKPIIIVLIIAIAAIVLTACYSVKTISKAKRSSSSPLSDNISSELSSPDISSKKTSSRVVSNEVSSEIKPSSLMVEIKEMDDFSYEIPTGVSAYSEQDYLSYQESDGSIFTIIARSSERPESEKPEISVEDQYKDTKTADKLFKIGYEAMKTDFTQLDSTEYSFTKINDVNAGRYNYCGIRQNKPTCIEYVFFHKNTHIYILSCEAATKEKLVDSSKKLDTIINSIEFFD